MPDYLRDPAVSRGTFCKHLKTFLFAVYRQIYCVSCLSVLNIFAQVIRLSAARVSINICICICVLTYVQRISGFMTMCDLIRSHMEYCSSIFSSAAKTQLKKLDVIQRKAARIIYEVPRDANADLLLLFLKLDALNDRREVHLVNLIKSFISGKCHPCLLYTSPSPRDRQKSRMPSSA